MPKITVHGGPSFPPDQELPPGFQRPEQLELAVEPASEVDQAEDEGGEQPSPGNSSSQSTSKPEKNEESTEEILLRLAPTTENP